MIGLHGDHKGLNFLKYKVYFIIYQSFSEGKQVKEEVNQLPLQWITL
jgi:hypothetical protein